jgi:hypothetical protein
MRDWVLPILVCVVFAVVFYGIGWMRAMEYAAGGRFCP